MKLSWTPILRGVAIGAALWLLILWVACPAPPPNPDAVQQAAQRAANAIVTVERTDSALSKTARHIEQTVAPRARADTLKRQVEAMKRHDAPPEVIVATQDSVIAAQDSVIAQQDSALAAIVPATQAARDTLATYRTPIIPAVPQRSSLLAKIGSVTKYVGPSIGYGAVLADGQVETGLTALVGVHVTHGVIGATVGYGVTQARGELHTGFGANVGVRLVL